MKSDKAKNDIMGGVSTQPGVRLGWLARLPISMVIAGWYALKAWAEEVIVITNISEELGCWPWENSKIWDHISKRNMEAIDLMIQNLEAHQLVMDRMANQKPDLRVAEEPVKVTPPNPDERH